MHIFSRHSGFCQVIIEVTVLYLSFRYKWMQIIGFSSTVWTKMRSLAGSLADGVIADTILILPHPPILPTNIRKVKGSRKRYGN